MRRFHWLDLKTRKTAFGPNKTKPGRKEEATEAFYMDEARTDYLNQKAKDEAKENNVNTTGD